MGRAIPWIPFGLMVATGCGAGFRSERVGTIRTTVGPVGEQEPTLAAVPIAHARDRHRVDVAFYLPRAAEVRYAVSCPGQTFEGMVGESWEQYRERRLTELERQRQRDVDAVGALTGAVVGNAGAAARVETPNAEAEARAEVDGAAVGRAAADSTIPQVQLDPRDVGAQSHERRFELVPGDKGQCTVSIWSETNGEQIRGVTADLTVTRIVDIAAERAAERARRNEIALEVRGEITASLIAAGADPAKRERERRQREAEAARAREAELALRRQEQQKELERRRREQREQRIEIEARVRVEQAERAKRREQQRADLAAQHRERQKLIAEQRREQRVAIERDQRVREGAFRVRGRIVGELIASGCDPNKRQREREEEARRVREHRAEQARLVREHRAEQARRVAEFRANGERIQRGAFGVRARIVDVLIASGADPEYRRKQNEAELRAFEQRATEQRNAQLALEVQFHAALRVREAVRLSLIGAGAVDRPVPRPAPTVVTVPERVDVDVDVSADAAVWVPPIEVVVEGVKVLRPGSWRSKKTGRRVKVRDHRKRRR